MEIVNLKVEQSEGPLDLLLALISKHKIDIFDIPISEICDQYIAYLDAMRKMDMEVTSDDVIQLLLHVTMPDMFPINAEADFTGDSLVNSDDVIQLLLHVTMPDMFPLETSKKEDL